MIGGEIGRPVPNSTGPGTPMPIPQIRPGSVVGRREQLPEQLLDPPEHGLRPVRDGRRLIVVAKDPAIQRGDGDVDAGGAEIGDQDMPGVRAERQLARWAPAGRRAGVALDDQAAVEQLRDALGDDAPAEARVRDQLLARPRVAKPDLVEDRDERLEGLLGDRPGDRVARRNRTGTHRRIIRGLSAAVTHFGS